MNDKEILQEQLEYAKQLPEEEYKEMLDDIQFTNEDTRNLYYKSDRKIKNAGVEIEFNPAQLNEITKCKEDPIYFAKNYIKIVNLDKGLMPFKMWDWQVQLVNNVKNNRFNIIKIPRQSGKCVTKETKVTLRNKKTGNVLKDITIEEFMKNHI